MAVNVYLWTSLKKFTNEKDKLSIEAKNIGELVGVLERDFPGLKPFIDSGISFAVNGELSNPNSNDPLPDGAEIYLMQKLKGG
jgi:molybdopterin converting factor small subunit